MSLVAEVCVDYPDFCLDVAFSVAAGEVVAVLGPNGAGKSTVLAALAGLVPLTRGRVELDGHVLDDTATGVCVPPEQRPIGVVFQDYLLFPHLSALDNVAFGLRCRGATRASARGAAASQVAGRPANGWSRRPQKPSNIRFISRCSSVSGCAPGAASSSISCRKDAAPASLPRRATA